VSKHLINIVEIDAPKCVLEYGVTCSAAIGVTDNGMGKCFNLSGTCQVPLEFDPGEIKTIRWCSNSEYFDAAKIAAIPSLVSAEVSPQIIKPGESLGKRERCNIYVADHPHNDFLDDPYPESRDYNAFKQGTYLGKLVARLPNMVGYPLRRYVGEYDKNAVDILDGLEVSHYVVDKVDLGVNGMQIGALDALTFTDDKKALAPVPSNGVLELDMAASGLLDFTLLPVGIGATYATEGYGSIDKEYFQFTRVGDVITPVARGVKESEEKEHKAGATFQQAAVFSGNCASCLEQLLGYTQTPAEYYDVASWQYEALAYASEILDAHISTPTGVESLINRLMVEMGLGIWTDITNKKIKLRVLRSEPAAVYFSESNLADISPSIDNLSRVDTVFFRFGRINPVEKVDEPKNYYGNLLKLDDNAYAAIQGNTAAIREINSVFIPETLRQTASDTAGLIISRYNRLLRSLKAITVPEFSAEVGTIAAVTCRFFQDQLGRTIENVPMQVVSVKKGSAQHELNLIEYNFGDFNFETDFVVSIPVDVYNLNLRDLYESAYGTGPIPTGAVIRFEADAGVRAGSLSIASFSVDAGDWPEIAADGVSVSVHDLAILGKGGDAGGEGVGDPDGGPALYVRYAIEFVNCTIGGGGGAGSDAHFGPGFGDYWSTGGGGAGFPPGDQGTDGTRTLPDDLLGGTTNAGGGFGGVIGGGGSGICTGPSDICTTPGQPGVAIDGVSYVTLTGCSVYGVQIN
jgi:hypothetical protein